MLQDVEAGRPTELDALLGSVIELGRIVEIGTPSLQLVYDLCKFRCQRT
jgi:2-dehydropantoate 2-reductase